MKKYGENKMKCKQCGKTFVIDDRNPSLHYNPPKICIHCDIKNNKKIGDYYQKLNGEYIEVTEEFKKELEDERSI